MRIIELNASSWRTWRDFYDALLAALGAPEGHGRNLNALIDSMVWAGMNAVEAPYTFRISGGEELSRDMIAEIDEISRAIAAACEERRALGRGDVEIGFEITS
ncbi:barstar family protein [Bradyrhizobium sp. INPA01-394B]|uniref:Barstar family protein n=2 Tax=Bradyrhizobium campsiandrae TaxID=1729892 RepID=A0ABR7U8G4_9BRAD|nr:barstar family protein [Bradyrhizobium campsiandrae]MBC9979682.1 barstar family protein [Bradyrhizobium campsiandrae]